MLRPLGTLEQEIMDILWKKKEGACAMFLKY